MTLRLLVDAGSSLMPPGAHDAARVYLREFLMATANSSLGIRKRRSLFFRNLAQTSCSFGCGAAM
jgi:hypothetical protein